MKTPRQTLQAESRAQSAERGLADGAKRPAPCTLRPAHCALRSAPRALRPALLLLLAAPVFAGEDDHVLADQLIAEAEALAPAFVAPAPAATTATARINLGEWSAIIPWTPHIPVTAATLPDGRLLTFSSNQRTTFPVGPEFTYAAVWNPKTGAFTEINNSRHDMFCGGAAMLPDGRVLINGGRNTTRLSSLFDWRTGQWSAIPNMNDPRWYNTTVALTDGSVFTVTGDGGTNTAERWTQTGGWQRLTGIPWADVVSQPGYVTRWHPLILVAPDGRLFHGGPTRRMNWLTTAGNGSLTYSGVNVPGTLYPKEGCFALYDEGRILVAGGSSSTSSNPHDSSTGTSTTAAFTIDIRGSTPVVAATQPMQYARQFVNSVILPNGEVIAIGGNTSGRKFNDTGSILTPEIWNPASGQWREVAPMNVPRNYHSLALLLPDGRVWSGGGGLSGNNADHRDAQIFTPPQLYTATGALAARPQITQTPARIAPGTVFEVAAGAGVSRFTFIKMSSQTHSTNTDLRFLELPFTETSTGAHRLTAHANLNVMTPGYWMLFALDGNGVWSEASIIQVDPAAAAITPPEDRFNVIGQPVSLTVTATAPGGALTYSATGLPPGLAINAASGLISGTPHAIGVYAVTISVSDGSGGEPIRVSFTWTIGQALSLAPLSGSPVQTGAEGVFTASSTGGHNPRYRWNFGDGTPITPFSDSPAITHTFTAPGHYTITLIATDDTGHVVFETFTQIVHPPPAEKPPAVSTGILYEKRATGNDRVWVVNPDNDSVTAFDAVTHAKLAEIPVGKAPRALALAPDGRLWVTCTESSHIAVIDTGSLEVATTLLAPRGSRPFGLAFDPNGTACYIAYEGAGLLSIRHPITGDMIGDFAGAGVGQHARHVSVSPDGSRIYVSRFITPPVPGEHTASPDPAGHGGEVVVVDPVTMNIERTILLAHSDADDTPTSARGLPNYLGPVTIAPDGLTAWVPSKQDNIKRGLLRDGSHLTHDQTLRAIASRIDLTEQSEDHAARIDFDDAGMPSAAVFDPTGGLLFVALESTRAVAVVNPFTYEEIARFEAGLAPQGLAVAPDGGALYVHNFMDRSVSVFDITPLTRGVSLTPLLLATLQSVADEKLPPQILRGKQLFYDAFDNRLAFQRYISCAGCHNDGGHDGRTWDITGFGEGLRNTITLRGHGDHGPLHWSGNFDEVQDFEGQIRNLSGGAGLMSDADFHSGTRSEPMGDPKAGLSADLDALAAYVKSLTNEPPSPHRKTDPPSIAQAQAGEQVFRRQQCASCHGGENFTHSALGLFADIGTQKPASGQRLHGPLTGFDIPTLRGVWATAPYLHDGSAATLADAVRAHGDVSISETDLENLTAYLLQIDNLPATAPEPGTPTLSGQNIGGSMISGRHSTDSASGTHTLRGAGTDINSTADGFYGSFTRLYGDGEIRARVTSQSDTHPWAKAGIMIREDLTGGSRHATLFTTPGNGFGLVWRAAAHDTTTYTPGPPLNPQPHNWLRLTRSGDTITAQVSADGDTWATVQSLTSEALPHTLFVGLAVTSASPYVLGTATFDNVQILGGQFPLPDNFTAPVEPIAEPDTDRNNNGVHDLIEYAIGNQDRPDAGWWLETHPDGQVDAHVVTPTNITGITFSLLTTPNLVAWHGVSRNPVATPLADGWQRLTWSGIDTANGQNPQHGIVRLRVAQTHGITAASAPQGWQRFDLQPGHQTIGISLLNAPALAGRIEEIAEGNRVILSATGSPPTADDPPCYLEVLDGEHAGHRFDLATDEHGHLTASPDSPHNTLNELPATLAGARVIVRQHLTLKQVFDRDPIHGGPSAAHADQVLFHLGANWESHWLLDIPGLRRWTRNGDATLKDTGGRIIAPGAGLMLRRTLVADPGPATLTLTGHVRATPFRRPLIAGYNFITSPWPLDGTPNGWQFTPANGFTATLNPALSDQIQIWNGSHYTGYWLLQYNTAHRWTPLGSATLHDVGDTLPLPANAAFFLRARPETTATGWTLAPPR